MLFYRLTRLQGRPNWVSSGSAKLLDTERLTLRLNIGTIRDDVPCFYGQLSF